MNGSKPTTLLTCLWFSLIASLFSGRQPPFAIFLALSIADVYVRTVDGD